MYPTLYHFIKSTTGLDIPFLQLLSTFGLLVAVSFAVAFNLMVRELKRKTSLGLLKDQLVTRTVYNTPTVWDYVLSALLAFVVGFKLLPILFDSSQLGGDTQAYLFSTNGSWLFGGLLALAAVAYRYFTEDKGKERGTKTETVNMHPYQFMPNIAMVAAVSGFLGAKIFHLLEEDWSKFDGNYMGLISGGWTFFGGLICGAIGVMWYGKVKAGIPVLHMADIGGPAMMASYATGRMGCQFSGDGDWGISNLSPKPSFLTWLPDWAWAYNYPNNVANEGLRIPGCLDNNYCYALVEPVFPTPLYEIIMCGLLFLVLWKIRKKLISPGLMFGIYLMFSGVERFLIESIRHNNKYNFAGISFTQAQMISVFLLLAGTALSIYAIKKHRTNPEKVF